MKDDYKTKVINEIVKNGIFAVMFVGLLFYVINDSRQREVRYQDTIKILAEDIHTTIDSIKSDTVDIKFTLKK